MRHLDLADAKSNDLRRPTLGIRVTLEIHSGQAQNDFIWSSLI